MEKQEVISNRTHFIRFVRTLKEMDVNEASRRLSVSRRTIFYYEAGRVVITDRIFDHIIEAYGVTEYEVRLYLEYHEGAAIG